jgi:quercetin dioxygenase-like cupin family protein
LAIEEPGTHFGFIYSGPAVLRSSSGIFHVKMGMYFAVPGKLSIEQGSGTIVSRLGFRGLFHLGGPVEGQGRLRYIDGCTDSLLIPPVIRGDPCLNLLHIPPGTCQAAHTHPSLRAGLVFRGEGHCATDERSIELSPGQIFVIQAGGLHSFHTASSSLLVLAYHPDSDFGPTHENHPMINRTMIAVN